MRRFVPLAVLFAFVGCHSGGLGGSAEPKTEEQKTLYAIGLYVAKQIGPFSLKPDEMQYVVQGLRDGVAGTKPAVDLAVYGPKLNELARTRAQSKLAEEKKAAVGFLADAAKESGAEKTPSGLIYKSIKEGTGETPKATDRVQVHYHGTLRDGKVFDSSVERKQPATFALNQVVACWTEGVQKMKVGGKAKLTCPSEIAYGDKGRPGIPPGAPLTFEIELLSIEPPLPTPAPGAMSSDPHGMPLGMHGAPPGMMHGSAPGHMPGAPPPGAPNVRVVQPTPAPAPAKK